MSHFAREREVLPTQQSDKNCLKRMAITQQKWEVVCALCYARLALDVNGLWTECSCVCVFYANYSRRTPVGAISARNVLMWFSLFLLKRTKRMWFRWHRPAVVVPSVTVLCSARRPHCPPWCGSQ